VKVGLLLAILLSGLCAACSEPSPRFPAEGIVRGVDRESGQILIAHGDIEGLMGAMTMSFDVARPELLEGLATGDAVEFVVVSDGSSYRVEELVVTGSTLEEARGPGFEGLAEVGVAAPGFELIDQDGRRVSLASLRGRALVLDFVFTNCPGPCPILTATHVTLQRRLAAEARGGVHFVSISLDPERDTPEALRAYAQAHGADLAAWSFLTGAPDTVHAVLRSYGVRSEQAEDGEIDHVVVTYVIGRDGRISRRYLGLEQGVDERLRGLEGL